ncbi:hypothetical protein BDZ89DRAFT_1074506 [Hymenopellis radicata]|nr:hypothetical protein BDZ89DRAFT_1074506 [Hymenopellis radicata]
MEAQRVSHIQIEPMYDGYGRADVRVLKGLRGTAVSDDRYSTSTSTMDIHLDK